MPIFQDAGHKENCTHAINSSNHEHAFDATETKVPSENRSEKKICNALLENELDESMVAICPKNESLSTDAYLVQIEHDSIMVSPPIHDHASKDASLNTGSYCSSSSSYEDDGDKSIDSEGSGLYVPGYSGLIHRWQHPGYNFFAEPHEEETFPKIERLLKLIIVGDATVGKTSFVQRYVNDVYRTNYKGTIGVDFALKRLWKTDEEFIKLQLWDIAGQERFTWMTRAYYREAHGCIVMFDLTSNSSFINSMKWKQDVDSKCQLPSGSLLPAILVGNKCDLPHRAVNQEEVELVFKAHNYIGWTEVSAKDNLMIGDCINFLVDAMINRNLGNATLSAKPSHDTNLGGSSNRKNQKKPCC